MRWHHFTPPGTGRRAPGPSHSWQHLWLPVFSVSAILIGYLIVVLICTLLMTDNVELLFLCLWPIHIFWEKGTAPVQICCPLWGVAYCITVEFWEIHILDIIPYQVGDFQIVVPHLRRVFMFLTVSFKEPTFFILMSCSVSTFPFRGLWFFPPRVLR